MSWLPAPSTPTGSQKRSFASETEPLSSVNLAKFSDEDSQSLTTSAKMDCGVIANVKSILRKEREECFVGIAEEASTSLRRRISWNSNALETRIIYSSADHEKSSFSTNNQLPKKTSWPLDKNDNVGGDSTQRETKAKSRSYKLDIQPDEVPLVEFPMGDPGDKDVPMDETEAPNDEVVVPPAMEVTPTKSPKRKYQRKKKTSVEAPADATIDDGAALIMNDGDSDNETMLIIDEGDENLDVEVEKKGKKRKSHQEWRKEKEDSIRETEEVLAQLSASKGDVLDEFAILSKLFYSGSKKKEPKSKVKSREELQKEVEKQLIIVDPKLTMSAIRKQESKDFNDWRLTLTNFSKNPLEETLDKEAEEFVDRRSRERRGELEDMPDFNDLLMQFNKTKMNSQRDIDGDKKEKAVKTKVEARKEGKKKSGGKEGSTKKKKDEKDHIDRPLTEEEKEREVLAEIEKKKADATEKATRMKQQKLEDRERKRVERECKKEEEEKERKAKKRKKNIERNIMERKPKSRAEAARRTKALLALEKNGEKSAAEEDEEGEPKRKKRKYRRRTKPVSFIRRIRDADNEESEVGCGKYIENPCDMCIEEEWTNFPCEDEDSDDDQDVDEVLSVPLLWTSDKDKLSEGAIGPHNFDSDESMKRHLNDTETFCEGLNVEYRDMIKRLDGMKLNLFADTTLRRFDHRVVHNIDSLSTVRTWPLNLLPQPGVDIPVYQHQIWNRPFVGLVRVRPIHKKKDQITSKEIDMLSGCNVENVSKQDITINLDALIMSKLTKAKWTPLPSAHNPFDIPEILTRNASRDVDENQSVIYVQKNNMTNISCEYNNNKKRKKTRKEVLKEIATKPRPAVLKEGDIYIDNMEEGGQEADGYQFEWNEMGEIIHNPIRDNGMEEDPFAAVNPYDGMEYVDEQNGNGGDGMMDESRYSQDAEDETQLGEAFSFMATHLDV